MKIVSATYERHSDSSGTITETYEDGSVRHTPLPALWATGGESESFRRLRMRERGPSPPRPGQRAERMTEEQITRADRDEGRSGG
jgi:hypothetical protein